MTQPSLFGPAVASSGSGADMSPNMVYRFRLWRRWGPGPDCLFIGLNPSTADASADDPTIRRMVGFARREGCGGLRVCNIFALRSTDPAALLVHGDPIGPGNDAAIVSEAGRCRLVVAAWGSHSTAVRRGAAVAQMLADAGVVLLCIGTTKDGYPRHPLYMPSSAPLQRWSPP